MSGIEERAIILGKGGLVAEVAEKISKISNVEDSKIIEVAEDIVNNIERACGRGNNE